MFSILLSLSSSAAASGQGQGANSYTMIIMMVAVFAIMYFVTIRPQKKRQKEEQEMRNSLEIGDEIITIGGIVGRVVTIREEDLVIETGADRNKMTIQRWAVNTNKTKMEQHRKEVEAAKEAAKKKKEENYTEINNLPEFYLDAVVAVEDRRFYNHGAIDPIALARAILVNVKNMELREGGSTITQQLAKNIYFTQEKSALRKIAEMFMACEIEKNCDKDTILELYVNTSYFGDGYDTPKEACKGYFNKELNEMTDYECILLAGIPNAPSVYAPTKNPELAKQRQKQVMKKMIEYGYLTEEEADNILKEQ